MNTKKSTIAAVLAKYEDALDHSNTEAVMKLYTPGGVVMPRNFPSCAGADAVRKTRCARGNDVPCRIRFIGKLFGSAA